MGTRNTSFRGLPIDTIKVKMRNFRRSARTDIELEAAIRPQARRGERVKQAGAIDAHHGADDARQVSFDFKTRLERRVAEQIGGPVSAIQERTGLASSPSITVSVPAEVDIGFIEEFSVDGAGSVFAITTHRRGDGSKPSMARVAFRTYIL